MVSLKGVVSTKKLDEPWQSAFYEFRPLSGLKVFSMGENPLVLESFDIVGDELAVRWKDGEESYVRLETLRRNCPCATCAGETDLLGQKYGGSPNLSANSFALRSCSLVGSYGLQPVWADGHSTGIYSYQLLQRLGEGRP